MSAMKKDRGFMFQSFMEMWNVYPFTRQKSQTQTWCIQISFSARWLQNCWGRHLCTYYLVFSVRCKLSSTLCAWRAGGRHRAACDRWFRLLYVNHGQAPGFLGLLTLCTGCCFLRNRTWRGRSLAPSQPSPAVVSYSPSSNWRTAAPASP